METNIKLRNRAIVELVENVKSNAFVPKDKLSVTADINGSKAVIPAYIPYIGAQYFATRPRILCYAINQNLSKHRKWSESWISNWAKDTEWAMDRLNRAAQYGEALPIRPYAEGFIPLAAIVIWAAYRKGDLKELPDTIDSAIAVTNFVKFSTTESASSTEIPQTWWNECAKRYVGREIQVLDPDIILAFGKKTATEVENTVQSLGLNTQPPRIVECRFPARIPSSKARPLNSSERKVWQDRIEPLIGRLEKPKESFVSMRMDRFPGYFVDIAKAWQHAR